MNTSFKGILLSISFLTTTMAVAQPQAEYCAAYVCEAAPRLLGTRVPVIPASGYGDTMLEAMADAVQNCKGKNTFGNTCVVTSCNQWHGPAIPLSGSCVDKW